MRQLEVLEDGGYVTRSVPVLTQRLYDALPDLYRWADEAARDPRPYDTPLLRYLYGIGTAAQRLLTTIDRVNFLSPADGGDPGGTSELVDPLLADDTWLPWLGQLVGVQAMRISVGQRRDAIRYASSGWRAGSKAALADAARSALTGSRYVDIRPHKRFTGATVEDAGPFEVLVVTRASETPDPAIVLQAIEAKGARPAGVTLDHRAYVATWATLQAQRTTWAEWNGSTWTQISETGA